MQDAQDITLSELLTKSFREAQEILDAPSFANADRLAQCLSNLRICQALITRLALFSPNETLEDISTSTLRCFMVEFYMGLLTGQLKSSGTVQRQSHLKEAKELLQSFVDRLQSYEIINHAHIKQQQDSTSQNPALKRTAKVASYKLEKELTSKIKEMERRQKSSVTVNQDSDDSDEDLRTLLLTQLELFFLKASNELYSISMEVDLLANSIPYSDLPTDKGKVADDDTTWKLDSINRPSWFDSKNTGPILSTKGKVLRPFTILPSSSTSNSNNKLSTRLSLQSSVFQADHSLPTMSIDEYLQIEMERGNVLQGGEADAQRQDAESRRKRELLEEDNLTGYTAAEDKLQSERDADDWRDTHRRGDGNRIGRG